ncbi:hypothetical protein AAGG74_16250 [Bacillus mexicanus]|uniref:hypothetical protein n=1 Tax=Bacillus mexicanus TaxID=2834415 RepID=UPI003D24F7F6
MKNETYEYPWDAPEFSSNNEDQEAEENEENYPYMERDEDGFYSGECECGGIVTPMYDETPFWIAFCKKCKKSWENSESSPLPY